jgi:maltose-binding protein MalE
VTDNVIRFPKEKMNTPPQSLDDIIADMERMRHEHADEVASSMIPQLIGLFMANGIDVDQHEYIKDVSMIVESTKSLLYKYMNIEHPFHNMVESVFEFNYNDDDTVAYSYSLPTEPEEE